MGLRPVTLDYTALRGADTPSAYEYLLLDAMRGRTTLFARADEVEASWEVVQPVLDRWAETKPSGFPNYAAGTQGPAAADILLARDGRAWRDINESHLVTGD